MFKPKCKSHTIRLYESDAVLLLAMLGELSAWLKTSAAKDPDPATRDYYGRCVALTKLLAKKLHKAPPPNV